MMLIRSDMCSGMTHREARRGARSVAELNPRLRFGGATEHSDLRSGGDF